MMMRCGHTFMLSEHSGAAFSLHHPHPAPTQPTQCNRPDESARHRLGRRAHRNGPRPHQLDRANPLRRWPSDPQDRAEQLWPRRMSSGTRIFPAAVVSGISGAVRSYDTHPHKTLLLGPIAKLANGGTRRSLPNRSSSRRFDDQAWERD
jgi:hypothetical protein